MKIIYAAIFRKDEDDPKWWNVSIPDVWGAVTCGDSYDNAIYMAKDLLVTLFESAPKQFGCPTPLEETKKNFPNDLVVPIEVDLDIIDFNNKLVIKESKPLKFKYCKKTYKAYGSLFDYKNTRIFLLSNDGKIRSEVIDYNQKYKLLQYARSIMWEKLHITTP